MNVTKSIINNSTQHTNDCFTCHHLWLRLEFIVSNPVDYIKNITSAILDAVFIFALIIKGHVSTIKDVDIRLTNSGALFKSVKSCVMCYDLMYYLQTQISGSHFLYVARGLIIPT